MLGQSCGIQKPGFLLGPEETQIQMLPSLDDRNLPRSNGSVVRTRSVCRVVEASRWSFTAVMNVQGTTPKLCPNGDEDISPEIEAAPQQHVDRDFEERSVLDDEAEDARRSSAMRSQVRITNRDLRLCGYKPGCPRCNDLDHGKSKNHKEHSDEWRLRMYLTWQTNEDPKFKAVQRILEPDSPKDDLGIVELDDGSHCRSQKPDRVEEQPRTPTVRPWEFNSLDRLGTGAHYAPAPTSDSR